MKTYLSAAVILTMFLSSPVSACGGPCPEITTEPILEPESGGGSGGFNGPVLLLGVLSIALLYCANDDNCKSSSDSAMIAPEPVQY